MLVVVIDCWSALEQGTHSGERSWRFRAGLALRFWRVRQNPGQLNGFRMRECGEFSKRSVGKHGGVTGTTAPLEAWCSFLYF